MSDRQLIIDLISKMPEDAPLEEILRQVEFVAGIRRGDEQARRGQGIPAERPERWWRNGLRGQSEGRF